MVFIGTDRAFTFDHVFGTTSTQAHVYDESKVRDVVLGAVEGLNGTVLAYGQTGSGKTHTMGTAQYETAALTDATGIVPRALHHLFQAIDDRARTQDAKVVVTGTCIEIHKEEVRDLLTFAQADGPGDQGQVSIREDTAGLISLSGVQSTKLETVSDALGMLGRAALTRATAATAMNAASSRSHAVFTLRVETDILDAGAVEGRGPKALTAKLHFVDLAGSERAKRTEAVGERLAEGIQINKGLLALGNVICALTAERRPGAHVHVPYRDSKLTRYPRPSPPPGNRRRKSRTGGEGGGRESERERRRGSF